MTIQILVSKKDIEKAFAVWLAKQKAGECMPRNEVDAMTDGERVRSDTHTLWTLLVDESWPPRQPE